MNLQSLKFPLWCYWWWVYTSGSSCSVSSCGCSVQWVHLMSWIHGGKLRIVMLIVLEVMVVGASIRSESIVRNVLKVDFYYVFWVETLSRKWLICNCINRVEMGVYCETERGTRIIIKTNQQHLELAKLRKSWIFIIVYFWSAYLLNNKYIPRTRCCARLDLRLETSMLNLCRWIPRIFLKSNVKNDHFSRFESYSAF